MNKLLIRCALAVSACGLTAIAYTNVSAQALTEESESYLNQWIGLQTAFNDANTTPGFKTRLRGNRPESFIAYAKALEAGLPIVDNAVAAAERFSQTYGDNRKADTYGKEAMGYRVYAQIRRENQLKAASFLIKKTRTRHQNLLADIEYSKRTAAKKAKLFFSRIETANAASLERHHQSGARILNAALKVSPKNQQLKSLLIDGNARKRAREYALKTRQKDALLVQAQKLLSQLARQKIDAATVSHIEAMDHIKQALVLLEHDEQAIAMQRQWRSYMETRIKQWNFQLADKAEYIRRWVALGEQYHAAISNDAGALVVLEQLSASLETPITDVTETLLRNDYLQYETALASLDLTDIEITAFTDAYGKETATRFSNHKRLMITEDNYEDHSSFFSAFSHLSKASQQTPDQLIRKLAPLRELYMAYPPVAVKKYLSWAKNLLAKGSQHHEMAVLLVEAAARFAPENPKIIKMQKTLGMELKTLPAEQPEKSANEKVT